MFNFAPRIEVLIFSEMKIIKILGFLIVSISLLTACKKEQLKEYHGINDYTEEEAMADFAELISKAVFDSKEIRDFLKQESLKMFDNDYDILYPVVKDKLVNNDMSFRNFLLKYIPDEKLLKIEETVPLLTIYVPDMRWLGESEFYAEAWDTESPYVATTYQSNGICREVFAEGIKVDELEPGVFPACPTLIIKKCERIEEAKATKLAGGQYRFLDEAFNGIKTKYQHPFPPEVSYWQFDTEDVSDEIPESELRAISSMAADSYEYMKPYASYASQRDYAYYGMTSPSSTGMYDLNVVDRLFRFRLFDNVLSAIRDDYTMNTNGSADPKLNTPEISDDKGGPYKQDEIISKIWGEGSFEIGMYIIYGENATNVNKIAKFFNIEPQELFQIKKVKKEYWHSTWIKWYQNWRYSVNISDIVSKWYYPNSSIEIADWSIREGHSDVILRFFEVDSGAELQRTEQFTYKFTHSSTTTNEFSSNGNKTTLGLSSGSESSSTTSIVVSWKQENDPLGDVLIKYRTPYISNKINGKYVLNPLSTGSAVINVLPYRYSQ